jgi:pyruvate/2-oxoglutarate dehydrogenase complex dihydrolipoamide dehydrogenase (E3) component
MRPPTIDGIDDVGYITNVEAVALDRLPVSMAIVGGGPIAVEFAQIFARFGVEVTIVSSKEHLLPKEEPELADALQTVLEGEGIRVINGARVTAARRIADRKELRWSGGDDTDRVVVEEVLLATGRVPNVARLGLDAAGVRHSERGIEVDAMMRTSVPHIFAVGDVTGIYPYTHAADYQARIALHNSFALGNPIRADYRVVPWTTFTDPELARVGLTENEAIAGGYAVVSATVPFADISRAIVSDERFGSVKLVVDRASHQILGGHILGARAGELIAEVALAMRHRLPVSAISDTIHSYPTMSEGVFWTAYQIVNEKLADSVAIPGT